MDNNINNKTMKRDFNNWIEDGNVVQSTDSKGKYYCTQDAMYRNKIRSKKELMNYFLKEFC